MFGTPLITISLVWKISKQKKVVRILIGLVLAIVMSFFLYHISLGIIFRDGMGPG
jgi:predicted permease